MMGGDLIESLLTMKMDIYRQYEAQDTDTGAIKKEWNYVRTIPCSAKGIISNSSSSRSGDKQVIGNKYLNEQYLEVRTLERLTSRDKIYNITDQFGKTIWKEINFPTETPTVFEVIGTTPITDPFGNIIAYNSSLKRSENQQIG